MRIGRTVANVFERLFQIRIFRTLPRGIDICYDLSRLLPDFRVRMVFDVGANVGQTTERYRRNFPECDIYSFEPVRATYEILRRSFAADMRVHCFQFGLGDADSAAVISVNGTSSKNSLRKDAVTADRSAAAEVVQIRSLDTFCDERSIGRIDVLKIDTEGWDLRVLKGAQRMLSSHRISVILIEAGTLRIQDVQVPYDQIKSLVDVYGYELFGFYEQVHDSKNGRRCLRRVDAAFISPELSDMAKREAG